MRARIADATRHEVEAEAAWSAVSAAFGALGRVFMCADRTFHVIHASFMIDRALGDGASASLEGKPLEEVFGRGC